MGPHVRDSKEASRQVKVPSRIARFPWYVIPGICDPRWETMAGLRARHRRNRELSESGTKACVAYELEDPETWFSTVSFRSYQRNTTRNFRYNMASSEDRAYIWGRTAVLAVTNDHKLAEYRNCCISISVNRLKRLREDEPCVTMLRVGLESLDRRRLNFF